MIELKNTDGEVLFSSSANSFYGLEIADLDLQKVVFPSHINFAGVRFINCKLSDIKIRGGRFSAATFGRCKLDNILFEEVTFQGAHFYRCDINKVNVFGTNMQYALFAACTVVNTNFMYCNLSVTRIKESSFSKATFQSSNLYIAQIIRTKFDESNFRTSSLKSVYATDSTFTECHTPHFQLPQGELIGWKVIADCIVKIRIPFNAQRTASLVSRKCRCSLAFVESIYTIEGESETEVRGGYADIWYKVGESIEPDAYDPDPWVECTNGIHFFLTKKEAVEYGFNKS